MLNRQTTPDPEQLTERTTTRRRLFKGAASVTAAAAFVPAASGPQRPTFPNELNIDVQPDNADNFIDVDEHDSVEVAVHPVEFLNGDGVRETFDPRRRPSGTGSGPGRQSRMARVFGLQTTGKSVSSTATMARATRRSC